MESSILLAFIALNCPGLSPQMPKEDLETWAGRPCPIVLIQDFQNQSAEKKADYARWMFEADINYRLNYAMTVTDKAAAIIEQYKEIKGQ